MTSTVLYQEIRKIVWGFADLIRDKGNGTVEDYSKVVLPTCLVKRALDLQEEFINKYGAKFFELVDIGASTPNQAIADINNKSYQFFNSEKLGKTIQASVILIGWKTLMEYKDNPNGEEVDVTLKFGQVYKTKAKHFAHLMFEVIEAFNPFMKYVFEVFEYEDLIIRKQILPYSEFYRTAHEELSKFEFNMSNISTDMFSDMYMDLIGRFASDSGKKGGEFFTPTPLVKNAWLFLDIEDYAKKLVSGAKTSISIGDPTAGSNTFLIYGYDLIMQECTKIKPGAVSKENFFFYGQELKNYQYSLGLMNMIFHNTVSQYNLGINDIDAQSGKIIHNANANVITKYETGIGKKRGQIDLVVANPPYGTKNYGIEHAESTKTTDERWKYGVPKKQEGEYSFLMTIHDLLNKQGKAVVVMPLGTLFRDGAKAIRQHLLQEDVIEGLVTLPGNMFLTTSIPVVLWILNKNKKEQDKGKVFMVNASKDFKKVGKFNEWQHEKALNNYLQRVVEEDYSGYVDFTTLEKNKFNLSIQRYFTKEKEKEEIDFLANEKEIAELEDSLYQKKQNMNSILSQIAKLEAENE